MFSLGHYCAHLLLIGPLLWSTATHAQPLSEADVIRLAKAHAPEALAARAAVGIAEAQRLEATLYPNPSVGWDREHFPGSNGESEDSLSITIPIELSPRRAARKHLARANVTTATARAARAQTHAVVHALRLFYQLAAEKHRSVLEQKALARLMDAARIITRRREEGSASGYDQARIEIEAELAASTLRQTQAHTAQLSAELALLLGAEATQPSFSATLEPNDADITSTAKSERRSVALLHTAAKQAGDAVNAAAKTWLPSLSISAGPRMGRGNETRFGYVAGVAIDLPVFSRGQGTRAEAGSRQRFAQARAQVAARATTIATTRAAQKLTAARKELTKFDSATNDRIDRLERAVESGYREGQRSIVELLDARRARTTVQMRRLGLALSVKHAEVALRAATGDFE